MSNFDLPQDVLVLTEIPTFLLRGHPDNDRVLAEGAARIAANPPPKIPPRRKVEVNPDKVRPTAMMKHKLVKLGWSAAQAERVNRCEAEFAIAGGHGPSIRFTSKKPKDPDAPAGREAAPARRPPSPPREKKKARVDLFSPADVITVLAEANPCRPGSAAHAVFEKYQTGMTVAEFDKAVKAACPGKLRPVDYLVYDSCKGRIAVGKPA